MATPSKAVQFRDIDSVVAMYENAKVAAFGVKQNSALNFKYQGDSLEDGAQQLRGFLDMLADSESAAIYTLALYEEPPTRITEKTPVDLSWNFRLRDHVAGYLPGEQYNGIYGQLMNEVKALKAQVAGIAQPEPENKLGIIGEILEMEPVQPLLMAIGNKLADLIIGPPKPEIRRVSGVPGLQEKQDPAIPKINWCEDLVVTDALNRLEKQVDDLPALLKRLADLAEGNPAKFKLYLSMFIKMT